MRTWEEQEQEKEQVQQKQGQQKRGGTRASRPQLSERTFLLPVQTLQPQAAQDQRTLF